MSVNNWVALIVAVIASLTALYVGYAQRRQMRQIEAHRLDPEVGLKPPPHPVAAFLLNHIALWGAIFTVVVLLRDMHEQGPVTRRTVLVISFDVAAIFTGILQDLVWAMVRALSNISTEHLGLMKDHLKITRAITETLSKPVEVPSAEQPK